MPRLPPHLLRSYDVLAPPASHWRPATCAEIDCPQYLNGWRTSLDVATQQELIHTVRTSGRRPSAVLQEPGRVTFVFEPGTPCFAAATHQVRLERPELYIVRGGNAAVNTGLIRRHTRAADWVEDLHEHQDPIITAIQRG